MEKVPALASLTRGYTLVGFSICRHWTLDNFFLMMRFAQLLRVPGGPFAGDLSWRRPRVASLQYLLGSYQPGTA